MATSPRRLRFQMTMRSYGALGCVWLVVLPTLLFLLCQLCQTQLKPHHPRSPPLLPSSMDFLISRVGGYHPKVTKVSPSVSSNQESFSSSKLYHLEHKVTNKAFQPDSDDQENVPSSRLYELERKVREDYLYIRLALAASSGSFRHTQTQGTLSLGEVQTLQNLRTFQPLLTPREKAHLLYLLELFSNACQTHSLAFFLLENSLQGSVRHHGMVPWKDVSVTVGMSKDQQKVAREVLQGVEGVILMWPDPNRWSLRLHDTRPEPPTFSRMTYIVIQFFQQNSTHVWAQDSWNNRRLFTADLHRVFPLALRPFEGHMMPVPCDVTSVLDDARDVLRQCRVVVEDLHEAEFRDAESLPCDVLARVFPFVTRREEVTSQSVLEHVMVNDTLVSSAMAEGVCHQSFP
ncbi:hypothetical protein ACOMHN_020535 [Nucella lapillus]